MNGSLVKVVVPGKSPWTHVSPCEDACMIHVDLPKDEAIPAVTRSFAACVASVTETPIAEVPQPPADLPGAVSHWRS